MSQVIPQSKHDKPVSLKPAPEPTDSEQAEDADGATPAGPEAKRPFYALEMLPQEVGVPLRELVLRLWAGKWIILCTMIVTVGLLSLYMMLTPKYYTVRTIVAPATYVEQSSGGNAANLLNQFAPALGLTSGSTGKLTNFDMFLELIGSVELAERVDQKHNLLREIFASRWDGEKQEWVPPREDQISWGAKINRLFGIEPWVPPSAKSLAEFVKGTVEINRDFETIGIVELSMDYPDPEFAVRLLSILYTEADGMVRENAIERSVRQRAYVENKLQEVTYVDLRQALFQLLVEQEAILMMGSVDLPFAAELVDTPNASERPTFPRPVLFLQLGIAAGLVLGAFLVLLIGVIRGDRGQSSA